MARPRKLTEHQILQLSGTDLLRQKLREIRLSRQAAETKGAFTAVASLHKLEVDLAEDLATQNPASDVSTMSTDDLVDVLVGVVPDLSEAAAQRLQAALSARPPHLRLASGGA